MITLIKAPSILGLGPTGVEQLPEALVDAGLIERLGIKQVTSVASLEHDTTRDPVTHMLNPQSIADYSPLLADAVQEVLDSGSFPLVLGGDCTILLGNTLALRRRGQYGLFFLDGHADFYQPEASVTGEGADMDLALVSGRGPEVVTNIEGLKPLVADKNIVQFGQRDKQETLSEGSQQIADTPIAVFELEHIQNKGVQASANAALKTLLARPIEGFWVHIDADVISDREMPAVEYRQEGGLSFAELREVLEILFASRKVVGLDLAIYNPKLDPERKLAGKLVELLEVVKKYV